MTKLILACCLLFELLMAATGANIPATTKAYTSWRVGSPNDFKLPDESVLNGGILLAGGSTDQDSAMRWFLRKALGGDVIVFRNAAINAPVSDYPTADAYNPYLYTTLGVSVNSVETILLNTKSVANDPEVYDKVKNAEAIFFTGGDQATYYTLIKGSSLEDALNYFINVKHGVIGGTSAGCAIQGEYIFSAENDTIISTEAIKNPYDYRLTIKNEFLKHKILRNTITDTHFWNRDREGRLVAFMARIVKDKDQEPATLDNLVKGVGVDEKTVVCVESNGFAYVYGSGNAYFMRQSEISSTPEVCQANRNLEWYYNRKAVKVFKLKGSPEGANYFNLNTWNAGSSVGTWHDYYVEKNKLFIVNL